MDHKQKSKLTPFQEKTPFFQKSNAKTLKNSFLFQKKACVMLRFFRKMYAQCRLFAKKRETFYIKKRGEKRHFRIQKQGK